MEDMKDFLISSIMVSVVVLCLLTFGISFGSNYNKSQADMITSDYNLVPLQEQLNKTQNDAESWQRLFKSDNLFVVVGGIILKSIWGITVGVWTSITSFVVIYIGLVSGILGIPSVVTGAILSILIISLIFLGWRLIKIGW